MSVSRILALCLGALTSTPALVFLGPPLARPSSSGPPLDGIALGAFPGSGLVTELACPPDDGDPDNGLESVRVPFQVGLIGNWRGDVALQVVHASSGAGRLPDWRFPTGLVPCGSLRPGKTERQICTLTVRCEPRGLADVLTLEVVAVGLDERGEPNTYSDPVTARIVCCDIDDALFVDTPDLFPFDDPFPNILLDDEVFWFDVVVRSCNTYGEVVPDWFFEGPGVSGWSVSVFQPPFPDQLSPGPPAENLSVYSLRIQAAPDATPNPVILNIGAVVGGVSDYVPTVWLRLD